VSEQDDVNAAISGRKKSMVGILRLTVIAIGCGIALSGCASKSNGSYFSGAGSMPSANEVAEHADEDRLGIRLAGLRLSAAGYILDFRYRVVDPSKAAPLLDKKIRPYLLDDASGAQLGVPDTAKLGQLRTTGRNKVVSDQDYFIIFANPGRFVQAGNKMTLVMGDLRIENLTVE
jgi:hypothetical protein